MTMATMLENAPRIIIRQNGDHFDLESERSTMVSGFLKGKPLVFAKTLLTSLMGLCPVSHREAFEAACQGSTSNASGQRVAIEAMLESVRVFGVDWQRYASRIVISEDSLWQLGQLRQRLFDVLATQNEKDTERLFFDTQRFVRHFQLAYADLPDALLKAVEVFSSLSAMTESVLLKPDQLKQRKTLEWLLNQLEINPLFAIEPRLSGPRLVGSVARVKPILMQDEPLTIKLLVLCRWLELSRWAGMPSDDLGDFMPAVFDFDDGRKVAVVETVRGPLVHVVKTDGVLLADCHVIAPTEWVFQSNGIVIEQINEFVTQTTLKGKALHDALSLLVSLFDACTDVQVGETHA